MRPTTCSTWAISGNLGPACFCGLAGRARSPTIMTGDDSCVNGPMNRVIAPLRDMGRPGETRGAAAWPMSLTG